MLVRHYLFLLLNLLHIKKFASIWPKVYRCVCVVLFFYIVNRVTESNSGRGESVGQC